MKIKNKIKIIITFFFLFSVNTAKSYEVTLPNFGFICINEINNEKENLFSFLKLYKNITPFPSEANFILCKFKNNDSEIIFNNLAKEGIFVRKFSDEDLKNYLRISIGKPEQMKKIKNLIKSYYEKS